jgi:hypothetical protein
VKGPAPLTRHHLAEFGESWNDADRDGCDQRKDALRRDLTEVAHKVGMHGFVALSGTLADPCCGTTIQFTRRQDTSGAVQIDHDVARADAWQKGAGDTATWLPPNTAYCCALGARQVVVRSTGPIEHSRQHRGCHPARCQIQATKLCSE